MAGPTDARENGFEDLNAWRARTDGNPQNKLPTTQFYIGVAINIQLSNKGKKIRE